MSINVNKSAQTTNTKCNLNSDKTSTADLSIILFDSFSLSRIIGKNNDTIVISNKTQKIAVWVSKAETQDSKKKLRKIIEFLDLSPDPCNTQQDPIQ